MKPESMLLSWSSLRGVAYAVLIAISGCALVSCRSEVSLNDRRLSEVKAGYFAESEIIGHSVNGHPIELLTLGTGPDYVLILATIHGNEAAGTPMVRWLERLIRREPRLLDGRRIALLPVFNPDGYIADTRTNANGVDLNRNYPAKNRENSARYGMKELSEPESQALMALLEKERPARIVTIHQPLDKVDWDGPAKEMAERMAEYCELPAERIGARPGSLGAMCGDDWQLPIITYELPKETTGMDEGELWRRFGGPLLAAITWPARPPEDLIKEVNATANVGPSIWTKPWPWIGLAVVAAGGLVAVVLLARRGKNDGNGEGGSEVTGEEQAS